MSSINGLRELVGTSLDNSGVIRLGNQLNPGITGQVIKSNGVNNAAAWGDESIHTNEKLTIGGNLTTTSGNLFYDGSVAETINLNNNISIVDLTASGSIFLFGLPSGDPKNPGQLYKDNYTGQLFVSL